VSRPQRAARTSDTTVFVARAVLVEAGGVVPFHAGTEPSRSGDGKSKRESRKGLANLYG
jgi:hypothetical protein